MFIPTKTYTAFNRYKFINKLRYLSLDVTR